MNKLSNEMLISIVLELDNPLSFSRTCKSFNLISRDPHVISSYLIKRHGKQFALYEAIKLGKSLCTAGLIDTLIDSKGAFISQYLISTLCKRFTNTTPMIHTINKEILSDNWGISSNLSISAFSTATLKFSKLYGEEFLSSDLSSPPRNIVVWNAYYDQLLKMNEIALSCSPGMATPILSPDFRHNAREIALLNALYVAVEYEICKLHFGPLNANSNLHLQFATAVIFQPKLLPLLNAAGWKFDNEINDRLASRLLLNSLSPTSYPAHVVGGLLLISDRSTVLSSEIGKFIDAALPSTFYISASVAGEILGTNPIGHVASRIISDAKVALKNLEAAGRLQFNLDDIKADLLRLSHGTIRGITEGAKHIGYRLEGISQSPELHAFNQLTRLLSFQSTPNSVPRPTGLEPVKYRAALQDLSIFSPTQKIDIYSRMLTNEFLGSVNIVLLHAAQNEIDCPAIAFRCISKLVRMPSKGATLLSLAAKYPTIVLEIKRAILEHKINLDLLKPLNDDATDSSRPLFTSRPSFLSPIAFDYQNCRERYLIPLGLHPWVELCYYSGIPAVAEDSYISSSPWPAKQKTYFQFGVERGSTVTGNTIQFDERNLPVEEKDHGIEWTKDRIVKGSLPLAIAFLDLFDPVDEVLEIVLMHSLLNTNPVITHFYLQKGVPLKSVHLEAVKRLNLPMMETVRLHLEKIQIDASNQDISEKSGAHKERKWRPRTKKGMKSKVVAVV